jgi:hypothetical protein
VTGQGLSRGLFIAYVVLAVLTVGLLAVGRGDQVDEALLGVLLAGFAVVGRLLTARRPDNRVGWILAWIAVLFTLDGFAAEYASRAPASDPRLLAQLAGWMSEWVWYLWLALVGIALPLVFPSGRLPSPRWRPVAWMGTAGTLLGIVCSALKPGRMDVDADYPLDNPLGLAGAGDELSALAAVASVMAGGAFVGGGAALVVRLRRAHGVERQQLKWFAYVAALMVSGLVVASLAVAEGEDTDAVQLLGAIGWMSALGLMAFGIPAATGVAILRHRLYDIDLVIRRTLIYASLTAALVASYLGCVLLLQLALDPVTSGSSLAVAASTLAVAAMFGPARARIQALVDRRFYRRKYDAELTVEEFGARLRDEVDLETLAADLRRTVSDTVQPSHVSLWLR